MVQKLKNIKPLIIGNQDLLLVNLLLLVKTIIFCLGAGISFGLVEMLVSTAALLIMFSAWFTLLPNKARIVALLLYDLILSTSLLADSLFYSFFHSAITIPALFEATLVSGIGSSVFALLSKWHILLYIDFAFLIPYFLLSGYAKRLASQPIQLKKRLGWLAVVVIVCALTLGITTKAMAANFGENAYIGLNWNNTVLQDMGIFNYHIYDLYSFVKEKDQKGNFEAQKQAMLAWIADHRKQTTHNYTAVAKGQNLIIVQLEAMQQFLIGRSVNGQEITPNLNRFLKSSMYFDNYFTQIGQGNTSDAELMTFNSLYPSASGSVYIMKSKNSFQSLPWLLKSSGYSGSYVFHAFKPEFWNRQNMYPSEGVTKFFSQGDYTQDDKVGMGLSDESMYRQTVAKLATMKQPFSSMVITLSGHYPYDIPDTKKELNIPQGQYSQMFTNYLQAQHYADKAFGEFINELKQQGLLDNSLLVVYGDHFGTGWTNNDLQSFLGTRQPLNELQTKELNKVPMLIHFPSDKYARVQNISGGEMDLLPTLINLLGLDNSKMFYLGQDLLNSKDGFSAFRFYAPDGTFATNQLFYIASSDGIFEHGTAYDRKSGQKVDVHQAKQGYETALAQVHMSDLIMAADGLPKLVPLMR